MLGLISQEIQELVPAALAIIGICGLAVIVCLITRTVTIRGMRKFWPDMRSREIEDLQRQVESLQTENRLLRKENNERYVDMKTIKAVTDRIHL